MTAASSRVIVVSGLPCSGKSTFVTQLRDLVTAPLIAKDVIKERLFDAFGVGDREWSRRASRAAYALMFLQAEELVRNGQQFILEGNFRWSEHAANFARLQSHGAQFLQVHCMAKPVALIARFRARAASGQRHPGHVDTESMAEIEQELSSAEQTPLGLEAPVVACDTTVEWQAAIQRATEEAARWLRQP